MQQYFPNYRKNTLYLDVFLLFIWHFRKITVYLQRSYTKV